LEEIKRLFKNYDNLRYVVIESDGSKREYILKPLKYHTHYINLTTEENLGGTIQKDQLDNAEFYLDRVEFPRTEFKLKGILYFNKTMLRLEKLNSL
jgi:hypothetical protein